MVNQLSSKGIRTNPGLLQRVFPVRPEHHGAEAARHDAEASQGEPQDCQIQVQPQSVPRGGRHDKQQIVGHCSKVRNVNFDICKFLY